MSLESAKANTQNIVRMAREVGLEFNMDSLILTNTYDAHRLTMFAETKGLMNEMTERILRAYFTESRHIGDHDTLIQLASEIGLNKEEVAEMLASEEMGEAVRADEQAARQYGVTGVPFYLINKKFAITGAQPTEVFVQALEKIIAENEAKMPENDDGRFCDDTGCEIPEK